MHAFLAFWRAGFCAAKSIEDLAGFAFGVEHAMQTLPLCIAFERARHTVGRDRAT